MLRKRIIASVNLRNNLVVQSIGYKKYLPLGSLSVTLEYLNKWGIDEVLIQDISCRRNKKPINFNLIAESSKKLFVPLCYGGGIENLDDVEKLMNCGVDKVALNYSSSFNNISLIKQISSKYGAQCILGVIDIKNVGGKLKIYDYQNNQLIRKRLEDGLDELISSGVGEILLKSVDRDGSKTGYEKLILEFTENFKNCPVPLILSGGAFYADHLREVLLHNSIDAVAAGNLFHFQEHSVNKIKAQLADLKLIRTQKNITYINSRFNNRGELIKKSDKELTELLFTKTEEEII